MAEVLPLATPADRIVARMSRGELIREVHAQEQDLIKADRERDLLIETLWPGDPPADDITTGDLLAQVMRLQSAVERLIEDNAQLRAEQGARRA